MNRLLVILLFLNAALVQAYSPSIVSYYSKDYNGHQANYDALFNEDGILYVANAYGVLEFDGNSWNKIPLPFSVSPLSLTLSSTGRIYVGGDNEFGFLERNAKGVQEYHSLRTLVDKENVGRIIHCEEVNSRVYFLSLEGVYIYEKEQVVIIDPQPEGKFLYLGQSEGQLYVMEWGKGVGLFNETKINWLKGDLKEFEIKGVRKISESSMILFGREKIVKYTDGGIETISNLDYISDEVINDVDVFADGGYLISTEKNGAFVLDQEFGLRYHLDQEIAGIAGNYVYSSDVNKYGDAALATNNGIVLVEMSSSVSLIDKTSGVYGAGYSLELVNDTMYTGSSQGLYYCPNWSKNKSGTFTQIKGTKAFIYDIFYHDGELFCGDQSDVYIIKNTSVQKISEEPWRGAWTIKSVPNRNDLILVGTYTGIDVYQNINGRWKFKNKIEGLNQAGRLFEFDKDGSIWLAHGLNGLFKISVDKSFEKVVSIENYNEILGLQKDYFNDIIIDGGVIRVSSFDGVYKIVDGKPVLDFAFDKSAWQFDRLRKIREGLLYTVIQGQPKVLKREDDRYVVDKTHILNNINIELVGSAELIKSLAGNKYLVGTPNGFIHCDNTTARQFFGGIQVRKVETLSDDSLVSFYNREETKFSVPYEFNGLRFYFSCSAFEDLNKCDWYASMTKKGELPDWKKVGNSNFKEYQNLPEGEYEFSVKADYKFQNIGSSTISFVVHPPWYRTTMSKIVYVVLCLIVIWALYRLWKVRLENALMKVKEEKQRELMFEKVKFKEEKLKMEIQEKEMEMSYLALNHTQKKELLNTVRVKLQTIIEKHDLTGDLRAKLKELELSLKHLKSDEQKWDDFQIHFNQGNNDFLNKIKSMDPNIKESTLLMCTYIRMGKNNKEIANLLNISLSALDKRKSRLKEKFEVDKDITLNEYLKTL